MGCERISTERLRGWYGQGPHLRARDATRNVPDCNERVDPCGDPTKRGESVLPMRLAKEPTRDPTFITRHRDRGKAVLGVDDERSTLAAGISLCFFQTQSVGYLDICHSFSHCHWSPSLHVHTSQSNCSELVTLTPKLSRKLVNRSLAPTHWVRITAIFGSRCVIEFFPTRKRNVYYSIQPYTYSLACYWKILAEMLGGAWGLITQFSESKEAFEVVVSCTSMYSHLEQAEFAFARCCSICAYVPTDGFQT